MIRLLFSLTKAEQIIQISLKRIENTTNIEDKITEIDHTWHQLYGVKSVLDSIEIEMIQETRKTQDFQQYKEFSQIYEIIYHHLIQLEEMYEKAIAQQGSQPHS